MNSEIAKILRDKFIEPLNWKDAYAGLVNDFVRIDIGENAKGNKVPIRKVFPISCDASFEECTNGKYQWLAPNVKKRSVIYFEDRGSILLSRNADNYNFTSRIRMTVWFNSNKFGYGNECDISPRLIGNILQFIPVSPFNESYFSRISIKFIGEEVKDSRIFSRFTYDEPITQYLLKPYGYFALNFEVNYTANDSCFEEILLDDVHCNN